MEVLYLFIYLKVLAIGARAEYFGLKSRSSSTIGIAPEVLAKNWPEPRYLSLLTAPRSRSLRSWELRRKSEQKFCGSESPPLRVCVRVDRVESECFDKDIVESESCSAATELCCIERKIETVDEGPCGTVGSSIRSPRRTRPDSDSSTKDICWMAAIVVVKASGEQNVICDSVIFNSTAVLVSSECIVKINEEKQLKVLVRAGTFDQVPRQSQDFSKRRCGQEFDTHKFWPVSDSYLLNVANKGFTLINLREAIQMDQCTCRVCTPTADVYANLSTKSRCLIAGSVKNGVRKEKQGDTLTLTAFRTNILSMPVCEELLGPQKLPERRMNIIKRKLICAVSPEISGSCRGRSGGSLTCQIGTDARHVLIGLSIQPLDCYSAPRLFRNLLGCLGSSTNTTHDCQLYQMHEGAPANSCGRLKNGLPDPFSLSYQTTDGSALRHRNVGRRIQMLSPFAVSDAAIAGRSGFSGSEVSQPGLHVTERAICWVVAVLSPHRGHCSGVLIHEKFVLTAAHCVTTVDGQLMENSTLLQVSAGFDSFPRDKSRECEEVRSAKSVKVHPLYSKPSGTRFFDLNDLALIELDQPIDIDNNPCICKVCLDLATRSKPHAGEVCTLSGYGCPAPILASETCPVSSPWPLTWSNLVVLGDEVCSGIPQFPSNAMTCTVADGGPSACYGDSGGPLVCYSKKDSQHYLHGIFSFILTTSALGPQRCRTEPLNPNYYTTVANYLPWLIENVPGLELNV